MMSKCDTNTVLDKWEYISLQLQWDALQVIFDNWKRTIKIQGKYITLVMQNNAE